eukprot:gb/GECH01002312.1/.p1 GENE.gb/GECH01002312.1/~~gb/GECH01002312.1/.p1  ORF type:complete len:130 (+),score=38.35 gb/GECH01002312.1/:1-390(+)
MNPVLGPIPITSDIMSTENALHTNHHNDNNTNFNGKRKRNIFENNEEYDCLEPPKSKRRIAKLQNNLESFHVSSPNKENKISSDETNFQNNNSTHENEDNQQNAKSEYSEVNRLLNELHLERVHRKQDE